MMGMNEKQGHNIQQNDTQPIGIWYNSAPRFCMSFSIILLSVFQMKGILPSVMHLNVIHMSVNAS
jgi:hypothetical protein